jgi:undecaprenyl-diphosphatase
MQSIILGVIQGLTEFLPISSSGHLVLVPAFFHWDIPDNIAFIFDVLVQIATLIGVIAYFCPT